VPDSPSGLRWQPVSARDIPAIVALYAEALAVDGGQPYAGDEALLRRWYTGGIEVSLAAFDGGRLAGVCARRHASTGDGPRSVIAGQVAPGYRGRRIGARLLDAALDGADPAIGVLVENESLTGSADALYRSRGLHPVFAEDVMTLALDDGGPAVARPAQAGDPRLTGLRFTEWSGPAAARFYAVYTAAFAGRPGFPGWPASEWIERTSGDPDFRADWTLLASVAGADTGFIAGDTGGWIAQVGVVPAARRQGIATRLIVEVLRRMREAGETRAVLDVNVNNPGAIAVYEGLGFVRAGRRARYEPAPPAPPARPVRSPGPSRGRE
jgi:mycothiol synthase